MSLILLSSELINAWTTSYDKDTVIAAEALAAQIHSLKGEALQEEIRVADMALNKHNACMTLHYLVLGEWWRSDCYERLHHAMDDVADGFNTGFLVPIPIWAFACDALSKYKGGSSNMTWCQQIILPSSAH